MIYSMPPQAKVASPGQYEAGRGNESQCFRLSREYGRREPSDLALRESSAEKPRIWEHEPLGRMGPGGVDV